MALSDFEGLDPISGISFPQLGIVTTSRYYRGKVFSEGDERYLGSLRDWEFPETTKDLYYQVNAGEVGNLPLISWKVYGTYRLWWAIAVANGLENPLVGFAAGDLLRIPSSSNVYSIILGK